LVRWLLDEVDCDRHRCGARLDGANLNDITVLGVALGVGLIIGLERGWRRREAVPGSRAAGLRTFGLFGLLGGLASLIQQAGIAGVLPAAWLSVSVLAVAGYVVETRRTSDVSLTTAVAAVTSFALGAAAGLGYPGLAAGAAVVVALLLAFKEQLHGWVAGLSATELASGLQLLLISVVLLPLLPDRAIGPGGLVNPRVIGWAVALIAALSFAAYVAVRVLGPKRGLLLTALLGGLVSSTAVTATLSRCTAREPHAGSTALAGIVLACSMAFVRMLILLAVIAPVVARGLMLPLGAAGATGLALGALAMWWARGAAVPPIELRNPLDLPLALKFGLFAAVVMALSRWLATHFGQSGLLAGAAAAGLADVDAITLSLGQLVVDRIVGSREAAAGVAVAACANLLTKATLSFTVGTRWLGVRVVGAFCLILGAGFMMS
jgi:uncharacterized membrane protein (DUF4010 family)